MLKISHRVVSNTIQNLSSKRSFIRPACKYLKNRRNKFLFSIIDELAKKVMPKISNTEAAALNAGKI